MKRCKETRKDGKRCRARANGNALCYAHAGNPPANAGKRFDPETLSRDEVDRILFTFNRHCPTGLRNYALTVVLWRCGLRIDEALKLTPGQVDWTTGGIQITNTKTGKPRPLRLDRRSLDVVREWRDVRRDWNPRPGSPLFCSRTGSKLWPDYARRMLKRKAARAGIDRRVHPHMFRHTFAAELHRGDEGGRPLPVQFISAALGHSKPSITDFYLRAFSNPEVEDALGAREW